MREAIIEQLSRASELLYQNREQEGLTLAAEIIGTFKDYILQTEGEQVTQAALGLLRELVEHYRSGDVLGLADTLAYPVMAYLNGESEGTVV